MNEYRYSPAAGVDTWAHRWAEFLRAWGAHKASDGKWVYPTDPGFPDAAERFWEDVQDAYGDDRQIVLDLIQDLIKERNQ